MNLLQKFNKAHHKLDKKCLKCGSLKIEKPQFARDGGLADWTCQKCDTKQLAYIKSKGFRYYAFLLSGSWTSEYIIARSLHEAFKYAQKLYKTKKVQGEKVEVLHSYLRGRVDGFVLDGWFGF